MPPRATHLKDGSSALQSLWDIFDRCMDLWSEEGAKSHPKIPKEGQPGYALIQAWFDAGAVDGCTYNIGQVKRQFVLYRVQRRPELGANHNTREGESVIAAAADSYHSRLVLRVSSDAVVTRAMELLMESPLANDGSLAPLHRHVIAALTTQIKTAVRDLVDKTLVQVASAVPLMGKRVMYLDEPPSPVSTIRVEVSGGLDGPLDAASWNGTRRPGV